MDLPYFKAILVLTDGSEQQSVYTARARKSAWNWAARWAWEHHAAPLSLVVHAIEGDPWETGDLGRDERFVRVSKETNGGKA